MKAPFTCVCGKPLNCARVMPFTTDYLAAFLPQLEQARRIYVGYSGGMDSTVLLHVTVKLVGAEKITALHINHQVSPNANQWQAHCAEQCRQFGVALQAFRVSVANGGDGFEQAARQARYSVFEAALDEGDLLLLAHHANDQAETLLYRLLRGSGPRGLAAMPRQRTLGKGLLLRPLLDFSRAELNQFALSEGLNWVEDEANERLDYDRNFLRHRVMPVLQERWPDLANRLSQTAALCRQADDLNQELAEADFTAAAERQERSGHSLDLRMLAGLSLARRHNLLRFWLQSHGYAMPPQVRLQRVHRELIEARDDANPVIELGDCELRRYNERIYLLPPLPPAPAPETEIAWNSGQPLVIAGAGRLVADAPISGPIVVRFRQGGERCRPAGRQRSQTLKKLLQEYRLEPWLRDRVPLVFKNDVLIYVGDLFTCEDSAAPDILRWSVQKTDV